MVTGGGMREILLHGGADETFDRSVVVRAAACRVVRCAAARGVHDRRSAVRGLDGGNERGAAAGTAPGDGGRSARAAGPPDPGEDQERLGVEIVLRTGPAADEVVLLHDEHAIDLAIVQSPAAGGPTGCRAARCSIAANAPSSSCDERGMIPSDLLVSAYASGWFPMAVEPRRDPVVFAGSARRSSRSTPSTSRRGSPACSAAAAFRSRSIATSTG